MTFDYSDEPGWPAEPTRVYVDTFVIMPRLPRMATRLCALDRHTRYRIRSGNQRRREAYAAKRAAGLSSVEAKRATEAA